MKEKEDARKRAKRKWDYTSQKVMMVRRRPELKRCSVYEEGRCRWADAVALEWTLRANGAVAQGCSSAASGTCESFRILSHLIDRPTDQYTITSPPRSITCTHGWHRFTFVLLFLHCHFFLLIVTTVCGSLQLVTNSTMWTPTYYGRVAPNHPLSMSLYAV